MPRRRRRRRRRRASTAPIARLCVSSRRGPTRARCALSIVRRATDGAVGRRRQVIPDVLVAFGRFLSFKALYMGKINSDGSLNVSARLADLLKKAVDAADHPPPAPGRHR